MDADFLREAYSIDNFMVLRNLPKYTAEIEIIDLHKKLSIPSDENIMLYQGVLLEGRGISKIINILDRVPKTHFIILGEGEYRKKFESEAHNSICSDRIHFLGAVNHNELLAYTAGADIGLALIENISISYYYALPNKLFEYIMAGIPVLASNLPQMKKVIDEQQIGKYVDPKHEDDLILTLNEMINDEDKRIEYKLNCKNAAKELNWDSEFKKIEEILLN